MTNHKWRTFQYLHYEDGRDSSNCLETYMKVNDIKERVNLRIETYNKFQDKNLTKYSFVNKHDHLTERIKLMDEVKKDTVVSSHKYECYHEIIHPQQPHRLYLDLDIDEAKLEKLEVPDSHKDKERTRYVLDYVLMRMKDIISVLADGHELLIKDVVICETPYSQAKKKYSFHIITKNIYVPNYHHFKLFFSYLFKALPEDIKQFVDNTARSIQSLRITGCSKPNEPERVKKIISKHEFKDSLLSYIPDDAVELKFSNAEIDVISQPINSIVEVNDKAVKEIIELAEPHLKGAFKYRNTHQGIINFNRIKPSFCELCRRTHDTDNSLFITRSCAGVVYVHCRRDQYNQKVQLGRVINRTVKKDNPPDEEGRPETLRERMRRIKKEKQDKILKPKN